jgi:hypothetical protein
MKFGATLVFKVLSNLAFKNIPKNGQKLFIFSFYIPVQNGYRNLSWSINKSCRELNSKQLLFLGHFQKMSFTCSKIDLKLLFEIYLKNKKKRSSFSYSGRRLPSWPARETGPAQLGPVDTSNTI